jgi:multicomponent Na+:H+ antiporter subunit G
LSEILISLLLLAGTGLALVGAIGLIRLPDVYNRIHSTGKSSTLGLVGIIAAGTIYFSIHFGLTLKLLLVIPFLFWTASAGAYAIGRAAHRTGPALAGITIRDDLSARAGMLRERE